MCIEQTQSKKKTLYIQREFVSIPLYKKYVINYNQQKLSSKLLSNARYMFVDDGSVCTIMLFVPPLKMYVFLFYFLFNSKMFITRFIRVAARGK